ncbi:acyltransferase family protein [Blautia sp. MSJ-19]|uniref:acyltransferase family protein n=1 Tax=Blautia sp. MSJ-19 TaxID=2841517 RepID=UPI001C0EF77C|nr:acyltransferase family protein [Blautia sp. MSJ-19]MBU5481423.1 acyltransferase family protein [Blautia sp. MSJ-19]
MTFYLLLILVLSIYGVTVYQKPEFCKDYLSRENTMSIRGIFVLLVIAQHFVTYTELNGPYDAFYMQLRQFLGQNIVTVFLFYSGYGVYESIRKKGTDYIHRMPIKRILLTLLHFDCAVLLFCIVDKILGRQYPVKQILLAFTGWTSIGNSNWYVFAVLWTYIFTWIAFLILHRYPAAALTLTTLLIMAYVVVVHHYRPQEGWWYNTILCYAAGMWYSYFRKQIEKLLFGDKHRNTYYVVLLGGMIAVLLGRPYIGRLSVYILWTLCFTLVVILLTMKISIHNKILHWFGMYTFELYILQRIPMMILADLGFRDRPYVFLVASAAGTIGLAWVFKKVLTCMDKKILNLI